MGEATGTSRQIKKREGERQSINHAQTNASPPGRESLQPFAGDCEYTSGKSEAASSFAWAARTLGVTLAFSAILGTALAPWTGLAHDQEKEGEANGQIGGWIPKFDVAENATRFVFRRNTAGRQWRWQKGARLR